METNTQIAAEIEENEDNPQEKSWREIPWNEFIWDFRLSRRLEIKKVKTMGEVADVPWTEWMKMRGLGKRSLRILQEAIQRAKGDEDIPKRPGEALPPGTEWRNLDWKLFIHEARTHAGLRYLFDQLNHNGFGLADLIQQELADEVPEEPKAPKAHVEETLGILADTDPKELLALRNFGRRAVRLVHVTFWAGALYTGEAKETNPDLPWELKPWDLTSGKELLSETLQARLAGKSLGEVGAFLFEECADLSKSEFAAVSAFLKENGGETIRRERIPARIDLCKEDLFETHTPEKAWEICFSVAGVNPKEIRSLTRDQSLNETGKELGGVTRERIRQMAVLAIRKLNRNPPVAAAVKRFFETNQSAWLESIRPLHRSQWTTVLDPWTRAAIRSQHERIYNWAIEKMPETLNTEEYREGKRSDAHAVLAAIKASKNHTLPINHVAELTGLSAERIREATGGRVNKFVSRFTNGPAIERAMTITEKWRSSILIHRDELHKEFPQLDAFSVNLMLRNGVAWAAGPFIVIPPRHHPNATEPAEIKAKPEFQRNEDLLVKILDERPFWKTHDAVKRVTAAKDTRWIYWMTQSVRVRYAAPGWLTVRETLTDEEINDLEKGMCEARSLTAYLLAKETNSQLCDFPMWTPRMEMRWARWSLQRGGRHADWDNTRLAKIARPELWPPGLSSAAIAADLEAFKQRPTPKAKKKAVRSIAADEWASIAALILKTGGVSLADLNTVLARCARQPNEEMLNRIAKKGWIVRQPGYGWQPANPAAREEMFDAIHKESERRWHRYKAGNK